MSIEERESWAPAFTKLGYDHDQVMALSDTEFINCRDYLDSEGFKPGPLPEVNEEMLEKLILAGIKKKAQLRKQNPQQNNPNQPNQVNRRPIQQPIRQPQPPPPPRQLTQQEKEKADLIEQQNQEYQNALHEQKMKIEDKKAEAVQLSAKIREINEKAKNLPAEPEENGVMIAIALPNGTRITRKFGKDEKAENVFVWADEKIMNMESLPVIKEFDLKLPTGGQLDRSKTLHDQGITGRTMLNALLIKQQNNLYFFIYLFITTDGYNIYLDFNPF